MNAVILQSDCRGCLANKCCDLMPHDSLGDFVNKYCNLMPHNNLGDILPTSAN